MPAALLPACSSTHSSPHSLPLHPAAEELDAELSGCSLTELFTRVQRGEEAAFRALHRRTRPRLHGVAYRVLRSPDLAEDVVQDTYTQIWLQRHRYQPDLGPVLGWMTTIAHRRAVDRVRAVVRAERLETRYADTGAAPDADHQAGVVDAVSAAEVLHQALPALTPTQQEALMLTYWNGWTPMEAALLLGIPVPTMKSRMRSALLRLRSILDQPQPA